MGLACRKLYLRCLGGVYCCAFVSFWLQYPGLLGEDGLLPARQYWKDVESFWQAPSLVWIASGDLDAMIEGIAGVGAVLGALAFYGVTHGIVFVALLLCYLSLFAVGQAFLSFQWDLFLIETGAASILYAPWFETSRVHPAAWVLRALFVKFMVMSGAVKIAAECPTWQRLTALEYHFASTCLPTAEAWAFHSLPPFVLRFGTAVMFVVELVAPWLLLVPVTAVRRVGVLVQVPLQIAIQLTGNYNWFNMQTCVLLLPAWASDTQTRWPRFDRACATLAAVVLLAAFIRLFPMDYHGVWSPDTTIRNRVDVHFVKWLFDLAVNKTTLLCLYASLAATGVAYAARSPKPLGKLARLALAPLCAVYLGVLLLPLRTVANKNVRPLLPFGDASSELAVVLEPFRVSNSYGLFRRMTGVGRPSPRATGWGGQPPSAVKVPAVIVEVSKDGREWTEVEFRYAPFKEWRPPRRTAPHQPRLDWQMWFAALGSYHHNPWLVHLLYKIVRGDANAALDLLAWRPTDAKYVRASLYHYDFTRIPSPWAAASRAPLLNCSVQQQGNCNNYWFRERVRDYVPTLDKKTLLEQVVRPQGWPVAAPPRHESDEGGFLHHLGRLLDAWLGGLRRVVGWQLPGHVFLDGPLVIIIVTLALPCGFATLLRLVCCVRDVLNSDDCRVVEEKKRE